MRKSGPSVLVVTFISLSSSTLSYSQELIPDNVAVDIDRQQIAPKSLTFENTDFKLNLPAGSVSSGPSIAAVTKPRAGIEEAVITDLSVLAAWPMFPAFQSFLLSLPGRIEMLPLATSKIDKNKADPVQVELWPLRNVHPDNAQLTVKYEKTLVTANNAFALHPGKSGFDPDNAIFFKLSSLNVFVPEVVFWTSQSSFVNGLVTRLVLGKFEEAMKRSSSRFHPVPPLPKPVFGFPSGKTNFETTAWPADKPIGDVVSSVLKDNPIQGDCLLYGWYAGEMLLQSGEPKYVDAVWSLLKRVYDTRHLGLMTGYTLSYLEGYAKNLQYSRPKGAAAQDQAILDNLARISAEAGSDTALRSTVQAGVPPAAWLNQVLFNGIANEEYNVAIGSSADRIRTLRNFRDFLQGFNQGAIRSANVIYADTFLLAYGIGYQDGFADGYAKGYAEGYRAGYAQGQADAPSSSFWGDLGNFLSDAGKAVGIISSIVAWF